MMADTKLSALPETGTPTDADQLYLNDGGTSKRMTVSNAKDNYFLKSPELKDYSEEETAPTSSGGTLTLDITNGNVFSHTLTENITTLALTGWPASGKAGSMTLILTQHASAPKTLTWPGDVLWDSGNTPSISSSNGAVDIYSFISVDAGATVYGFTGGKTFA